MTLQGNESPNPRLQRTPLRAPLSRKPLGATRRSSCGVAGAVLLLPAMMLSIGCAHRITADYVFRAEGVVSDDRGQPIPRVQVTLEVVGPVYSGVTPVKHADIFTDDLGHFGFGCLSHEKDPSYTLGFEKQGYTSVLIEGAVQAMNPHLVTMVPVAK